MSRGSIGWCSIVLTCLFYKTLAGQPELLHLTVKDDISGLGVPAVVVSSEGVTLAITDEHGQARLACPGGVLHLHFSHVTYEPREVPYDCAAGSNLVVVLDPAVRELPTAEVGLSAPQPVYANDQLHVATYAFGRDGLWVLAYARPQLFRSANDAGRTIYRDVLLVLLDTAFNVLARCPFTMEATGLSVDRDEHVYVETLRGAFACEVSGDAIVLEMVDAAALHEGILPWTDTVPGWLIGNTDRGDFPAFDHIAYDPATDDARLICSVVDQPLMQLFRSQYKYMSGHDKVVAMDLSARLGVDKQIIAGYMTGFQHDQYFRAPYAPLFVAHDTLYVFDHYRGRIRLFDGALTAQAEVPITYQNDRDWSGRLVPDRVREEVFASFEHGPRTWLRSVNVRSGELGSRRQLEYRYPDQVQVQDGWVYYVHDRDGALNTRVLYRERLR